MPAVSFEVESYTVTTSHLSGGSIRLIVLTSPNLSHGIRNRAWLYFFDTASAILGTVTNVDQPNFDGLTVYASCRKPDFAELYDMLRNEKPLMFKFAYTGAEDDPSQPTRELYWIELYTGQQEPTGEGPEELQAKLFSGVRRPPAQDG